MKADDLTAKPKKDLVELARKLGITGRTAMTKEDLARAILKASPSPAGGSKTSEGGKSASASKPSRAPAKKAVSARGDRAAKSVPHPKPAAPARPEAARSGTPEQVAPKPAPAIHARESAPPPPPAKPAQPPAAPPPPPRPLPPSEARPPQSGWQAARPPRDIPSSGTRRNIPSQDPAMKLSRVEEIRKSIPGRAPGKPGRHGGGPDPRNMRQGPGGGRPMGGDRRGDRFPPKGGPPRGGMDRRPDQRGGIDRRPERRDGIDKRNDPHAIERSLQAREHLRRSSEGRRTSGYNRDSDRQREARPTLEPPRPAAIPEHLARIVAPPPPPPARTDLEERTGHPLELPESYGADRVVLLVRDPYWLHAYWEVTPDSVNRVRSQIGDMWTGHRWLLRMYAYPEGGGSPGSGNFDIELNPAARNWYIQVPNPDCAYEGTIGILTRDGTFHPLAKSNRVRTPRNSMSDVLDVEWASTDDQWKQIYALSGGPTAGLASGSSAELGESLQERLKEGWFSGMLGSMGSGALAATRRRGFWFQVNTELILYGSTEPDAGVSVQGRKINLRPDGTFTLRFQLPDGVQEIPCVATSADGISERTITPVVRRQTTSSERETAATKDPEI